jgi:hypothetical protein
LGRNHQEAQIYRQQLEAGKIRLLPEKPAPKPTQKDEVEQARP